MFHVDQLMKKCFLVLFLLVLSACNKPDPHPELRDPIYKDIEAKQKELTGAVESEKKALEEAEKNLSAVVPQTGQVKFARKRVFEIKARIEKLEQLKRYYTVRLESRKFEAQDEYLSAFDQGKGTEWPAAESYTDYQTQESARTKSRNWSVKSRIEEELKASAPPPAPKGGH
jgi:DNA repair ATPase RecN